MSMPSRIRASSPRPGWCRSRRASRPVGTSQGEDRMPMTPATGEALAPSFGLSHRETYHDQYSRPLAGRPQPFLVSSQAWYRHRPPADARPGRQE